MLIKNRYFSVFRAAARGMEAQRIALGTATENIANANTSKTTDGQPYAIKRATHEVSDNHYRRFGDLLNRMQSDLQMSDSRHLTHSALHRRLQDVDMGPTTEISEIRSVRREYDPAHPHANVDGYVEYPDINMVEEMARMVSANRIYEANLTAVQAAKEMIKRTLEI